MRLSAPADADGGARACRPTPALLLLAGAWAGPTPASPSAGALYPVECQVVEGDDGAEPGADDSALTVSLVDAVRRRRQVIAAGPRVEQAVREAGLDHPRDGAHIVIAIRPWISMRKYGHRGLLYAQLDAAHFATHLHFLARAHGMSAELRFGPDLGPLAELVEAEKSRRLIHAVLTVRPGATPPPDPADRPWTRGRAAGQHHASSSAPWLESACWESIADARAARIGPTGPVTAAPVVGGLTALAGPAPLPPGTDPVDLVYRRRSAKGFAPATLARESLAQTLAALRIPVSTDLGDDGGALQATLLVGDVEGLAPGAYRLVGRAGAAEADPPSESSESSESFESFEPSASPEPSAGLTADNRGRLVAACMGQEQVAGAAAVVLFHAASRDLFARGGSGVANAVFRAGAAAHLIYLGATAAGTAVTAVGGFDSEQLCELARLPEDHEVLYLVLLGTAGAQTVKADRLQTAFAQNER